MLHGLERYPTKKDSFKGLILADTLWGKCLNLTFSSKGSIESLFVTFDLDFEARQCGFL